MKLKIKSKFGEYTVQNINKLKINKNKNYFYLIDDKLKAIILKKKITKNTILLKASENEKSFFELGKIINKLIKLNIKKNSTIIAIGGGITQDIAGFISSILFRGIKWQFYPTTVLSQGDSCIGSKTSINFKDIKNQLGNFYPPSKIFIYNNFIKHLKKKDIYSGLGELLHYFLISNTKDWKFYKINLKKYLINNNKIKIIENLIMRSLFIKKRFIEKDEMEVGERILLNYGHSFGHAIEKVTKYNIPHGLAVAHGINIANFFSLKLKMINKNSFDEIENVIGKIVNLSEINKLNIGQLLDALKKDKKNIGNDFRFILTKGIGKMIVKRMSNHKNVKKYLKDYIVYVSSKY